MRIALLTGGHDLHYVLPLTEDLTARGIGVDFIGNDSMQDAVVARCDKVVYFNLRGDQREDAALIQKIFRIIVYYARLIKYTINTSTEIFHIQWLNKFTYIDRTLLNIFYKLANKKIVFTTHNVNDKERDGNDTLLNRLTLRFMYHIVEHIFVHTRKMKLQLIEEFKIRDSKITVIPFGINTAVPESQLTAEEAKRRLQCGDGQRLLLFFGLIAPYKGLEYLIMALNRLKTSNPCYRLLIAGKVKKGHERYWRDIGNLIRANKLQYDIVNKIGFIPDKDIEIYFKAADVLILPYTAVFQSGVLLLSYYFGLPVIATDVGDLKNDVIEGTTGFICRPKDPLDLCTKIEKYFEAPLYSNLSATRAAICKYAMEKYSWKKVGDMTARVYRRLLAGM